MASTTKAGLYQSVMKDVGDGASIGDADTEALYAIWFDKAFAWVLGSTRWREKILIVDVSIVAAGFTSFTIPDSVRDVNSAKSTTDDHPIAWKDVDELVAMGADLSTTGTPSVWYDVTYDDANGVRKGSLYPLPDANFTLRLYCTRAVPSLDNTDPIPLPPDFVPVLQELVAMYAYENEEQLEIADRCGRRGQQMLARLVKLDHSAPSNVPYVRRPDGDLRGVIPVGRFPDPWVTP